MWTPVWKNESGLKQQLRKYLGWLMMVMETASLSPDTQQM